MIRKYYIVFVSLLLLIMAMPQSAFAMESVTAEIPFIVERTPGTVVIEAVNNEPLPAVTEFPDVLEGEFEIAYTEPGNYYYRVYQKPGDLLGAEYDNRVYGVTVSVFVNEYEMLYAAVTLSIDGNPQKPEIIEFPNTVEEVPPKEEEKPDDGFDDRVGADEDWRDKVGNNNNNNGANGSSGSGSSSSWLPQTGQLWWPVPIMIGMGVLLIVIGIMLSRKGRKDPRSEA